MSLGLTRDSVNDLASLDKSGSRDDTSSLGSHSLPQEEGGTAEISLGFELEDGETKSKATAATGSVTSSSASSYGLYSGFTADYAEYENYGVSYSDSYSPSVLIGKGNKEKAGFWCCLFPWARKEDQLEGADEDQRQESVSLDGESAKSDDEVSTGSAAYGEKLTENERAAVLARLRLASPEMPDPEYTAPEPTNKQKGLLNGIEKFEEAVEESKDDIQGENVSEPDLKSILRRGSKILNSTVSLAEKSTASQPDGTRRRSLFPQQYEQRPKKNKNTTFAPMARVVTVKSKNDMSALEKAMIWWQRQDYEDFKKTGRIIAKAMCEGGSEIWLTSNNAWQSGAKLGGGVTRATSEGGRAHHLSERSQISPPSNNGSRVNGDKWWHSFGHSRRGLEHIASVEEGRQRQANVRTAIRVVIDEQRRQKIYRKEDPEKLRMLSLQYTSWARDLALAAAASDAEAVEVNFDESRKSREFYLLKHARAQGGFSRQLPSFMMPAGMSPQVLDHHTSSQIRYRRKQARVAPHQPKNGETPSATQPAPTASSSEPVRDSRAASLKLAKQAAGFGTADSDVSAILSGMGAVEAESSMSPLQPQVASVGAH